MKKTIYLGINSVKFEYETGEKLQKEAIKYNAVIGNDCELGDNCTLGSYCTLGNDCELGDNCTLGSYCTLENGCELEAFCKLGNDCTLENGCKLGNYCNILYGTKITKNIEFNNYYKYKASGYIDEITSKPVIQLGCFVRFVEDWEKDWYNNLKEFPKGAENTKKRLDVYNNLKRLLTN